MDGFKDSTKTQYFAGGAKHETKGAAKVANVMGEFKSGKLHSGGKHGLEVTNPRQAVAISLSEARKAGAKIPLKRAQGGEATLGDMNAANRDVGGLSKRAVAAAGEAIARGNRMAVEEGKESRILKRKTTPNTREVSVGQTQRYAAAEPLTGLQRTLNTPPSRRGETPRGPAGAGFNSNPIVKSIRGALGLKKGGLAAMPKGKC